MCPYLIACPTCKWIQLDHLVGIVPFNERSIRTESCLVAADACDPCIVIGKELTLRNHFADMAAGIRVIRPQCISMPEGLLRQRSEEHTSELQSPCNLVCRILLEKKNKQYGL